MKKSRLSPSLASSLSLLVCGLTVLGASTVRAAECPATSPDRTEERRALAKEWFARAEAAENAGNDVEAVRNYACSMKMVAHAFTAFNLGRVAERSGDLELALKSYKAYLTLKADAPDKDEVQAKIAELEGKIREVKENIGGAEPAAAPPPASEEKPEVPVAPPPEEKPERPVKPSPIEPPPQVSEPVSAAPGSHHLAEWIVGGVAVVAGATWLTTYLLARSNMHTANTTSDYNTSQSAWSTAKTEAYTSYVAWPIALGAVIAEGVLLYIDHPWASNSDSSSDTSVGLGWTSGGLTLSAHGRF